MFPDMRESIIRASLPASFFTPVAAAPRLAVAGVASLAVLFLAIAVWNGFPLVF